MSINFIPATCPNCGGELRIPDDRKVIKCMYCGYDIVMYETEGNSVKNKVDNWFKLAYSVMDSNFEEAYHYFTNILEVEPESGEAWFGKALMACELSNFNNPRTDEIINLFKLAFKFCTKNEKGKESEYQKKWLSVEHPHHPKSEKEEMIWAANIHLNLHNFQYLMDLMLSDPDFFSYFDGSKNVFSIIDFSYTFLPSTHPEYIANAKLGIDVCKYVMDKKPKNTKYEFIKQALKQKYNKYCNLIKENDPNYEIPPLIFD